MKRIFLIFSMIIIGISAFAQMPSKGTGMIMGKIVDINEKPLPYVNIFLYKAQDTTVVTAVATGEDGFFVFKDVPFGAYDVVFKFLGFKDKRINNINVTSDNRFVKIGKVTLDADDAQIGEVVVQGQASTVEYKIDKKVINVSHDLSSQGGDATDALRNVPSVDVDVNGDVTIRGSSNFIVMINGKPSILDPNEALKQIPVSNIERIELITNPSAKYDPDGDAGIVNIITKNKDNDGFSGKIEVGADNNYSYKANVLLNYKKNKINVFTQLDYNRRYFPMVYTQYREMFMPTDTMYMDYNGENSWGHNGLSGKFGLNYYINDKNTLTFEANAGKRGFAMTGYSNQKFWYSSPIDTSYFLNSSIFFLQGLNLDGSIDFEHKFNDKGHKIKTFIQYSRWEPRSNNVTETDTTTSSFVATDNSYKQLVSEAHNRDRIRFQTDYELPIGDKSKFEAGIVLRYLNASGPYSISTYDNETDTWITDSLSYNNMTLNRKIYAGYVTFSSGFSWFDYELGLRTEYTDRLVSEEATQTSYPVKRFDIFPTVHLSKQLPSDQQLQLSYSRRINRPRGWNLNPFPRYIDQYTIRKGNPLLNPEYANSFELNYLKKFGRNSISLETYYKITEGKIDRIQQSDSNVIIWTAENLNKDYTAGGELSANLVVFKMLMINWSVNAYNYRLTGTLDGQSVDKSTFSWHTRLMLMTMLPTGTGIQIGGFYRAPTVTLQGTMNSMLVAFAGFRQSFFKRRLTLSVQARDLFGTMRYSFINSTDNFYSETTYQSKRPTIGFTLTYRIRNYKEDRKGYKNSNNESTDFMGEGEY